MFLEPSEIDILNKCTHFENNMIECDNFSFSSNIGILEDKNNSGKSYIILSLIQNTLHKKLMNATYFKSLGLDNIHIDYSKTKSYVDTTVLIIPPILFYQWSSIIDNFKFKTLFINKKNSTIYDMNDYNLVVITTNVLNSFAQCYTETIFKRIIFDEIDNLHIPNCPQLFYSFLWCVTQTPDNLIYPCGYAQWNETNLKYDIISVGLKNKGYISHLFLDISSKMSHDFIKKLIITNNNDICCQHEIISKTILCKKNNNTSVSSLSYLLDLIRNKELDKAIEYSKVNTTSKFIDVNDSIKYRIENMQCSICLNDISNRTILNCCKNCFCFECIMKWYIVKHECPLCKTEIKFNDFTIIQKSIISENKTKNVKQTKIETLITLLDKIDQKKVLIFASYIDTYNKIVDELNKYNIHHSFLKGSMFQLNKIITSYKEGNLNVLLLHANKHGCGINLENTTDIIMFDQFNKSLNSQVINKALIIGRKKPLNVWYLVYENENYV